MSCWLLNAVLVEISSSFLLPSRLEGILLWPVVSRLEERLSLCNVSSLEGRVLLIVVCRLEGRVSLRTVSSLEGRVLLIVVSSLKGRVNIGVDGIGRG